MTEPLGRVFHALADPSRIAILEEVASHPAASASSLARTLPISRQAIAKHLAVLTDAGLVSARRHGRTLAYGIHREPLDLTAEWLSARADMWDAKLALLKRRAESE